MIDISGMSLIGRERIMSRSGWNEQYEGGSVIERMWDSGEFSRRSKFDW
jgi:hypothetical protein